MKTRASCLALLLGVPAGVAAAHTQAEHQAMIGAKTDKPVDTADQVGLDLIIAEIRAAQAERAKSNPWFAGVIKETADGVIENLKSGDTKNLPAANAGVFTKMLDIQLKENRQLWELRRSDLPEDKKAARENEIKRESAEAMKTSGREHTVVMDQFHHEFGEAWDKWRAQRRDRQNWPGGLPNRGHIDDMLRDDPKNPSNWALSGQEKLASGNRSGGMADIDRSIALGGTPAAFASRSAARLEEGDFPGAHADVKKALEMDPENSNLIGLMKQVENRLPPGMSLPSASSREASASSSGLDAGGARSEGSLAPSATTSAAALASAKQLDEARLAMKMGDFQRALALAQKAVELNSANAAAQNLLAVLYARMRDYPSAIAAANAGLSVAPGNGDLLNNKAFAEGRGKKYRDALDTANRAIEAAPRDARSYANRAYAFAGLGDRDAMMEDLKAAASLDPQYQQTLAQAAAIQLPSSADVLFLFPGEAVNAAAAAPAASTPRRAGLVIGVGIVSGLLLALGLLSTVLAPLKQTVVSAFTRRRGPAVGALEAAAPQTPFASAQPGGLIRGQYEIVRQIGAGGMGMVYEGTDRSLGRRVAIKKMREEMRINPRERERFVIEAKTVASLHHPNIVDIYTIAEDGDDVYLVFEYVDGRTVHDLVQARGRLEAKEALRISRAMAEALAYAHARNVIHRDMKPSNVMLDAAGQVKVMDFGIARLAKDAFSRYSMTNTVVGTPPYMAPEQEQGVVRKESDVYSLAICSYEMLTGKLPFIGIGAGMLMNKINMSFVPPSRAIAGLPESLDEVFIKAFQANPDQRYRTPPEFVAALDAAANGVAPNVGG